jgi:DNA replication protein DnaC
MTELEREAAFRALFRSAGFAGIEMSARLELVPSLIAEAIPLPVIEALSDGRIPSTGFGLVGFNGCGKTQAICAMVQKGIRRRYRDRDIPESISSVRVCHWGVESFRLRNNPVAESTRARLEELATVPLLVLDDLGQERIKGAYVEDWGTTALSYVVSSRNLECLPILWTSNGDHRSLVATYGASFFTRLNQYNPMIQLPVLPDLRPRPIEP